MFSRHRHDDPCLGLASQSYLLHSVVVDCNRKGRDKCQPVAIVFDVVDADVVGDVALDTDAALVPLPVLVLLTYFKRSCRSR